VKAVLLGRARATFKIAGATRLIHGTCQGVGSANICCISMHRWMAVSVRGPWGSEEVSVIAAPRRLGCFCTAFGCAALAAAGGRLGLVTQSLGHDVLLSDFGQLEVSLFFFLQRFRQQTHDLLFAQGAGKGNVGPVGSDFLVLDPLHAGHDNQV
jgi:hypothetical protein